MAIGCLNRRLRLSSLAAALAVTFSSPIASQAQGLGAELAQAFQEGKVNVAFRYRYELVDDDNPAFDAPGFDDEANASTLRSRLTYQTASNRSLSMLVEMDDLRPVGEDDYNSTRNGKTQWPTVADPKATDLNQAYLKYTGLDNTDLIIGRQRIVRDNERFIGPVGWRQNEQTFDAASINHKFGDKLQAYYAFVGQVNRFFGPNAGTPPADLTGQTHLTDVTYTFGPSLKATAYGYFIDLEETPAFSSRTLGLRLAGDFKAGDDWSIPYAVEYAVQDDFAGNPNDYDADYYLAEAGVKWPKVGVKLSYEVLEGSTSTTVNEAFQTPLATAHAFQGWVDKFATTPAGGIEDLFLSVDLSALGGNIRIRYDVYQADSGSIDDYGDELGAWATWPVGKHYSVGVKYATFNSDAPTLPATLQDTSKLWFILSANF